MIQGATLHDDNAMDIDHRREDGDQTAGTVTAGVVSAGSVKLYIGDCCIGGLKPSDNLSELKQWLGNRGSQRSSRPSSGMQKPDRTLNSRIEKPVHAGNSRRGKRNVSQAASSQRRRASEEAMDESISGDEDEVDTLKEGVRGMRIK